MVRELSEDELEAIENTLQKLRPLRGESIPDEEKSVLEELILSLEARLDEPYDNTEEDLSEKRKGEKGGPYRKGYQRKKKYDKK